MPYVDSYKKSLPIDIRETQKFFILYKPSASIPAVQVQLEDGQTYDVYATDFERNPQISRLPLWEELLKMACTDGQAVYIFGKTDELDSVEPFRTEPTKNEQASIASRIREDAISFAGKARRAGITKNFGGRGYSAIRRTQR